MGVLNTGGQLGGIVAPVSIGAAVSATHGFAAGFAIMIAGFLCAAGCMAAVAGPLKRRLEAVA